MKAKLASLICLLLICMLLIAACASPAARPGGSGSEDKTAAPTAEPADDGPDPTETPNEATPAVMIGGTLYLLSPDEYTGEAPEEPFDGKITSAVDSTGYPAEDDSTNRRELVDASYKLTEDGVLLPFDGGWSLFVKADDRD